MELDRYVGERAAPVGAQLRRRAEIDHRPDRELVPHARDVRRREMVERVAAVDAAPADAAVVAGRVAAEVAEVETALEVDASLHATGIHDGIDPCPHGACRGTLARC